MPNHLIWDGNPGPISGCTPNGFFDVDASFQADGPRIAKWCAIRLGYPIVDIELNSSSFYAAFEDSVLQYSSLVNTYRINDTLLNIQGTQVSGTNYTHANIKTNFNQIIKITDAYGTEAMAGGKVTLHSASISLQEGVATYDLKTILSGSGDIEVRRIFHHRYFPYTLTSFGINPLTLLNQFGFTGQYVDQLMYPVNFDLLRMQAIELDNEIRRSAYSFELNNNVLRITPIPSTNYNIWIHYYKESEKYGDVVAIPSGSFISGSVSDFSNAPFNNMVYSNINDPGKNWIRQYSLAVSKEMLGQVRSKYTTVPIPGGEVSLNGADLVNSAQTEQEQLLNKLREDLEKTTKAKQLEQEKDASEFTKEILSNVPLYVYIG